MPKCWGGGGALFSILTALNDNFSEKKIKILEVKGILKKSYIPNSLFYEVSPEITCFPAAHDLVKRQVLKLRSFYEGFYCWTDLSLKATFYPLVAYGILGKFYATSLTLSFPFFF